MGGVRIRCRPRRRFSTCSRNPKFSPELISPPNNGPDNVLPRKRLAQRPDLGMQIVLVDDPPWPDPAYQLVFFDNGAIGLDERHEHVERAPAESQWSAVGENVAVLRQDLEPAKLEAG